MNLKRINLPDRWVDLKKYVRIMKLTWFLIVVLSLQSSASLWSQATKMDLSLENSTMIELFTQIEKNSKYRFFYSNDEIDVKQKISINVKNKAIGEILNEAFKDLPYSFKELKNNMILVESKSKSINEKQKQKSVSGKVIDESGQPLPGVSVVVKGTTIGVVTNPDGNYSLTEVPGNAILMFSFIGMKTLEIPIENQSVIDVTLSEETYGLDEVIVVGYGIQKKRDITGSITSIDSEVLESGTSADIRQILQGKVAGMNIVTNSAGAQQSASILVRGPSSLKTSSGAANAPLVVVDGIPYGGGLSSISAQDVESIEVLKDASSAAIYGTRASNGVILVTTKKGEKGKVTIQYRGTYGISNIAHLPNMMNGREFYDWKVDHDKTTDDPNVALTDTELNNYNNGIYTDWVGEGTQTGTQSQHTFSISGGGNSNKYYFSADMLQVEGIAINDKYDRFSYRLNFEQEITDWIKFGTNTNLIYSNRDGQSVHFGNSFFMNPLTSPYNEAGELNLYPWPEDVYFGNPHERLNYDNIDRSYKLTSNNYFDIAIPYVDGLKYRLNTGVAFGYSNYENYEGEGTLAGKNRNGVLDVRNYKDLSYTVENILTYKRDFNDHSIFLTGLASQETGENVRRGISASNFPLHTLGSYGANTGELIEPNDSYSKRTITSLMGRINYNYQGKYLITATVRRDGFSAFGANTKYGVFPSVALGWNIGEEGFIANNISWIDNLKLRASWGKNGNEAVGPYSTLAKFSERSYLGGIYADQTAIGYVPGSLASPNLGWEFSTTINGGIDFSLFKGRLSGSVDVYEKESEQILQETISSVNGVIGNKRWRNIGLTKVNGIELTLNATLIDKSDFSWRMGIVADHFKDEIVSLGEGVGDNVANRWFLGKSLKVDYGYAFDGIWQEGDDIVAGRKPGDVKVLDLNEDGITSPEDRVILGQFYPDFSFGISTTLAYKNLTIDMLFQGVYGVEKSNSLYDLRALWEGRRNGLKIEEFWTPDNPINTYHANDFNANHATYSTSFYEDASYLRFKNLKINYDFTKSKVNFVNFSQLNIFANAENLFTLTKWTGLDPELGSQTAKPLAKTYMLGVNVSF